MFLFHCLTDQPWQLLRTVSCMPTSRTTVSSPAKIVLELLVISPQTISASVPVLCFLDLSCPRHGRLANVFAKEREESYKGSSTSRADSTDSLLVTLN